MMKRKIFVRYRLTIMVLLVVIMSMGFVGIFNILCAENRKHIVGVVDENNNITLTDLPNKTYILYFEDDKGIIKDYHGITVTDLNYTGLIKENVAPLEAIRIGVYTESGMRKGSIALGTLAAPDLGPKLYSHAAFSDVHVQYDTASEDFEKALTYAETNCDFTCIAGDLTDSAAVESQLITYKSIVDTYSPTKPVYAIAGNHEHYSNYSHSYIETYTGYPLYYSFTKGDDVFIMVGHYGGYAGDGIGWLADETWSTEELQWLYETLEVNRDKRCFVFTHVLPHEHGVGNPNNLYMTARKPLLWYTNDGGIGQAFISLLRHYKNTILFHGHSHTRFCLQELDEKANYSNADGYRSVHIPSLAVPRDLTSDEEKLTEIYAESEGYVVDVYENGVILRGRDFVNEKFLPIATYYVDTTLQSIPAETYYDSTGTIMNENAHEPTSLPEGTTYRINQRYSESGGGIINADGFAMYLIPCAGDGMTSYVLRLKNTNLDITNTQNTVFLLDANQEIVGKPNGSKFFSEMSGVATLDDGTIQVEFVPSDKTEYIVINIAEKSNAPISMLDINDYVVSLNKIDEILTVPIDTTCLMNQRYSQSGGGIIDAKGFASFVIPCEGDGVTAYTLQLQNTGLDLTVERISRHFLLDSNRNIMGWTNGSMFFSEMSGLTVLEDGTIQVDFVPMAGSSFITLCIAEKSDTPISVLDVSDYVITLTRTG